MMLLKLSALSLRCDTKDVRSAGRGTGNGAHIAGPVAPVNELGLSHYLRIKMS